ncbi:CALB2 protein, partial [Indicator maculatus]|nr:CALB2 protein [Indicator maculatus]
MAGPQQAPHLHLAELTASQFLDVWRHFDADGNGYIEGKELENFFQELESARKGAGVVRASPGFALPFPPARDGGTSRREEWGRGAGGLAQILPTEENFLLCFRQHVGSSSEFME